MDKIAFVFAGQGAQTVGMGRDFYDNYPTARTIFNTVESIQSGIKKMCFEGPKNELGETINAQPCLFAVDLVCATVLEEKGVQAAGAAGFSLGEIPAAAFTGIFNLKQAAEFVCFRADAMHRCAQKNRGVMYAVLKLNTNIVEDICKSINNAFPVNYNCAGQTVVACSEQSAELVERGVNAAGGRAVKLAVSGAFHSPLMDEASIATAARLFDRRFGAPRIPLYSNVTADIYGDPGDLLARQINSPVLWKKTVENMIADGFDTFIEVGPGKVLTGFIKKIDSSVNTFNVYDISSLEKTAEAIQNA